MCTERNSLRIDLEEPRYDPDSYWGRVRNIFQLYNPTHMFASSGTLEDAKCLFCKYNCGDSLPEDIDDEELWKAKRLYESSYNTETGAKISFLGRPSSAVLNNMFLTGGLEAFFSSTPAVVVWHWLNQTYNAFANYANRGAEGSVTDNQIMTSYVCATGTAVATALGLNHLLRNSPSFPKRFVPFAAITAAHLVATPLLKAQMLKNGIPVYDDRNGKLGYSKHAAQASINGIILNKIFYAAPPFLLTPFLLNYLESRGTLCRYPWLNFPASVLFAGFCYAFLSPLALALLSPKAHFPYRYLEPELKEHLCRKFHNRPPAYVYYDKNL